jgi:cytochrome c-type biogenesis protein CcmH
MFWLTVTAMMIIALAIILLPLLRKSQAKNEARSKQNISIAKEQLQSLKQALQDGHIDKNSYQSAQSELEQALHSDLEEDNRLEVKVVARVSYKTEMVLTVMLPVVVISVYFIIGSPNSVAKQKGPTSVPITAANINRSLVSSPSDQVGDVRTLFKKLKQKLKNDPNNGQGWMMMGLSYMHFKLYREAVEAYQKAVKLLPDSAEASTALSRAITAQSSNNPEVISDRIEKKLKGANGQIIDVGAMVTRLRKRLDKNPDNLPGWIMLGRSYMNLDHYNDAIYAYQKALLIKADNPEVIQSLQAALNAQKNRE